MASVIARTPVLSEQWSRHSGPLHRYNLVRTGATNFMDWSYHQAQLTNTTFRPA